MRYVVPHFRISREAIESDIDVIRAMGAEFRFNEKDITIDILKNQGYEKIILGIGTWQSPPLGLEGGNRSVISAIEFLYEFNQGNFPEGFKLGHKGVLGDRQVVVYL